MSSFLPLFAILMLSGNASSRVLSYSFLGYDGGSAEENSDGRNIIQYVSTTSKLAINPSDSRKGVLNIFSVRNFQIQDYSYPEFVTNVQISTQGNESYLVEFLDFVINYLPQRLMEVSDDFAVIRNLSVPTRFRDMEYYFGTNWDVSNYSSIPYPLICEYPFARFNPEFNGKFYAASMPAKPISRIIFGCRFADREYCCGLECCESLPFADIMKTFLYFFGIAVFMFLVCRQVSSCNLMKDKKFDEPTDLTAN